MTRALDVIDVTSHRDSLISATQRQARQVVTFKTSHLGKGPGLARWETWDSVSGGDLPTDVVFQNIHAP